MFMEQVETLISLPRVHMLKFIETSNQGELLLTVLKGNEYGAPTSTRVEEKYSTLQNYWKERLAHE